MRKEYITIALLIASGVGFTVYYVNKKADEKIQAVKESTGNLNALAGDVRTAIQKASDLGAALGIKI